MYINEELAELYGVMVGDGCLSKYFANYDKRERFCVLITGHKHDMPYYRDIIRPFFIENFDIKGYISKIKRKNAIKFVTLNKKVFEFFKELNFPVGLKNKLIIPNNIFKNNKLSIACVRGIFDTDGTIYLRYSKKYKNHFKKYFYKNIQFHMKSKKIIHQIKEVLDRNRINTGKIFIRKGYWGLRIYDQNSVKSFFKLIKPSNQYHKERFLSL